LITQLYAAVCILLTCENHFYKTTLTPPHLSEVLVPSQESERSCTLYMYVADIDFASVSAIFYFILELF